MKRTIDFILNSAVFSCKHGDLPLTSIESIYGDNLLIIAYSIGFNSSYTFNENIERLKPYAEPNCPNGWFTSSLVDLHSIWRENTASTVSSVKKIEEFFIHKKNKKSLEDISKKQKFRTISFCNSTTMISKCINSLSSNFPTYFVEYDFYEHGDFFIVELMFSLDEESIYNNLLS